MPSPIHLPTHTHPTPNLFTSTNTPIHRVISLPRHLWFEIQIHQFSLLTLPLAIRIAIIHNLVAPRIAYFDRSVGEHAIGAPFDFVTGITRHEEGRRAASILVAVETAFDRVVEDVSGGYFFC